MTIKSYVLIFKAPILSLACISIRETANNCALSLIFTYKMKGKDLEIGSEGKKKEKKSEKKPTLSTLAKTPTFIFENTQFFPKCFHYAEE